MTDTKYHESVMTSDVVENLHLKKAHKPALTDASRGRYIDATLGTGGHTLAVAELGGEVLGIDADPEMLLIAQERLKSTRPTPKLVLGNFVDIDKIAKTNGFDKVSGIIFDLGVSNLHLKNLERGFSFSNSENALDMRLNHETQGVKASDLLNLLRRDQLIQLFEVVMDPGASKWLAGRIINFREERKIEKVGDLLEICRGLKTGKKMLNEATLPFLALRIAVNSELDNLRLVLPKAYDLLEKNGSMIVITFHSGEDEIVKEFFEGKGKVILPKESEIDRNPRARSAKLRILTKI